MWFSQLSFSFRNLLRVWQSGKESRGKTQSIYARYKSYSISCQWSVTSGSHSCHRSRTLTPRRLRHWGRDTKKRWPNWNLRYQSWTGAQRAGNQRYLLKSFHVTQNLIQRKEVLCCLYHWLNVIVLLSIGFILRFGPYHPLKLFAFCPGVVYWKLIQRVGSFQNNHSICIWKWIWNYQFSSVFCQSPDESASLKQTISSLQEEIAKLRLEREDHLQQIDELNTTIELQKSEMAISEAKSISLETQLKGNWGKSLKTYTAGRHND